MQSIRTPEKRQAFLEALGETCNVKASCELAGIAKNSAYLWRKDEPAFATEWDQAIKRGGDALEDEAVRRAKEGVDEPVFYKGTICGKVRKYSDTLLIFLLKGAKPEKYSERAQIGFDAHAPMKIVIEHVTARNSDSILPTAD
jgi:hypothetical protein